jgi:exosortase A
MMSLDKEIKGKLTPFIPLLIAIMMWLLAYAQTLLSMVEIWWRSNTFAHGFLIFPISLYLIYKKKHLFYRVEKQPSRIFLFFLFLSSILWLLANAVDVLVIQQLLVIIMLPLIVGTLYGFDVVKSYLFPFVYCLFAVPIGEFLIPELQQITAAITVFCLELSQIPVFHEGMFISIPTGDFEVAIACSGIRYLIASLALGTLYAYLVYRSYTKRTLFILAALIVPIFANGIRAYGIVLIAHFSNMKYATGVDHLIYGWLFFGVVIFILFYIGSFWEDEEEQLSNDTQRGNANSLYGQGLPIVTLVGLCVVLFSGPLYSTILLQTEQKHGDSSLAMPNSTQSWLLVGTSNTQWKPLFLKPDHEIQAQFTYKSSNESIYFYKNEYLSEQQGKELVNTMNHFYNPEKWIVLEHSIQDNNSVQFIEYNLRSTQGKLLILGWYEVLGMHLTSPIKIKMAQAWAKLSGKGLRGYFTAIATPHSDNIVAARSNLYSFYQENMAMGD